MVHFACRAAAAACFAVAAATASSDATVVLNNGGRVNGNVLPGVSEFLGIKFANAARYEAPVDFTGKLPSDPFPATDFGLACMQVGDSANVTYGSEDCLFINVWKPDGAKKGDNLPVLVYIYGGSNQFGESEPYNGSAVAARQGAVYATLSYRTGPIGWIPFGSDVEAGAATGNWGQMDQTSALRWVQREIANFGGDPAKVAIHGQSSGGTCTSLHVVMPGSKGLLRGLVGESGGLYDMDTAEQRVKSTTAKAAEAIGCPPEKYGGLNSKKLKECFQAVDPVELTKLTYKLSNGPMVDGVVIPAQPSEFYLPDSHYQLNNISVMIGFNTNDSMKMIAPMYMNKSGTGLRDVTREEYLTFLRQTVPASLFSEAAQVYPPLCDNCTLNVDRIGSVSTDSQLCSARRALSSINEKLPGKAFMYRFDWWYQSNSRCTAEANYHLPFYGSKHEDEVTFVMGQPIFMFQGSCCGKWGAKLTREPCPQTPDCVDCWNPDYGEGYHAYFNDKEYDFAKTVGAFWVRLAASGNPNPTDNAAAWPVHGAGPITHNIVMSADLPGGYTTEQTLYNNPAICALWDKIAALKHES
eukprot:Rhum_TRINITY_DN18562_c0_g1::Rhum_TRINITY_DN18562_c0_g1_i1::g.167648::m.167648/K03927/CES2; carboxylesterase 2